jgi:hypothetical protein
VVSPKIGPKVGKKITMGTLLSLSWSSVFAEDCSEHRSPDLAKIEFLQMKIANSTSGAISYDNTVKKVCIIYAIHFLIVELLVCLCCHYAIGRVFKIIFWCVYTSLASKLASAQLMFHYGSHSLLGTLLRSYF